VFANHVIALPRSIAFAFLTLRAKRIEQIRRTPNQTKGCPHRQLSYGRLRRLLVTKVSTGTVLNACASVRDFSLRSAAEQLVTSAAVETTVLGASRRTGMADEGDFEAQELARLAALEAAQRLRVERLTRSAALDAASPDALTVDPDAIAAATDLWQESADRLRDYQSGTSAD
jgi:hypothetical protein